MVESSTSAESHNGFSPNRGMPVPIYRALSSKLSRFLAIAETDLEPPQRGSYRTSKAFWISVSGENKNGSKGEMMVLLGIYTTYALHR